MIGCWVIPEGVLLHGGGHLAQSLRTPIRQQYDSLVADARSLEVLCPEIVSLADSVPQWNGARVSEYKSWLGALGGVLCANTHSHFLDTLPHSVQTKCTPSKI